MKSNAPPINKCPICGEWHRAILSDLCLPCAVKGETMFARMTVMQHAWRALRNIGNWKFRAHLAWAVERACRFGDYKKGGYFDKLKIDWRKE